MKNYLFLSLIIISGCSQNLGNLSIVSTQPTTLSSEYESIGPIQGKSAISTASAQKMPLLDDAINDALRLSGADVITDITVEFQWYVSFFFTTRKTLIITGEGWIRKEDHQGDIFDKDISIPPATDDGDFIVIDGVKYEREMAEVDPKTQVPPAPNKSETQKERKIIEYDPNTGEPIYE